VVSFPQASPPKPCARLSPSPYAPHTQPISFFLIAVEISSLNKQVIKELQRNLYGYHPVFLYSDPQHKTIKMYTQKVTDFDVMYRELTQHLGSNTLLASKKKNERNNIL
jgi:hypothetical protein